MTVRTDIHSPKNLVTEDYEFVEAFDTRPPVLFFGGPGASEAFQAMLDAHREDVRRLTALVASSPVRRGIGQCHHCGARLRYTAILRHLPTGDHIAVGETCLDNRFGRATAEFQRLRKAAKLDAERARAREAAAAFFSTLPEQAARAMHPEADLSDLACGDEWVESTLTDIRSKLWKWGNLSQRQVAFVERLVTEAPQRQAQRQAREAEAKVAAPTGRVEFEGVIVKVDHRDTEYGMVTKIVVKVEEPEGVWLAWVTLPSAICDAKRFDIVRMTATLSHGRDNHFAFGKRPTNAAIVGHQELGEEVEDSLA